DFLSYATHELRTPLTTIKTLVSLLRYTPLDAKAREYLDLVDAQLERQRRMITNLLDLARLEAGRYELPIEDVDLAQVLRSAARGLQPLAEGKGLSLTLHLEALPARIPSNASGLEQVFVNLIHNAIQFTDEGGVTITGGQDERTVWVTVEDTGIGMTPDQREHLFTKFYPMRAQAKRGEGTGLGLVISRMIVEALGGRIEVESTPGKGSRFTVRLPLHGAPSG
ncbi:MAG: HAMP domain-containing histidine kinase, partial [Chloroflexi bacterium]|nr:HAMP domain-containing histidine kinase [Chloroflexota bacterium]